SSQAHKGIIDVLRALRQKVEAVRSAEHEALQAQAEDDDMPTISLNQAQVAQAWTVEKTSSDTGETVFVIRGDKIEKFARRTQFDAFEGVNRLRDIMKKMGITHALIRAGAEGSSVVRVGADEFT